MNLCTPKYKYRSRPCLVPDTLIITPLILCFSKLYLSTSKYTVYLLFNPIFIYSNLIIFKIRNPHVFNFKTIIKKKLIIFLHPTIVKNTMPSLHIDTIDKF